MLVIDHENPNVGLGFRPDRQQRGGLAPVARLGDAVVRNRHGHRSHPEKRVDPSLRRLRATLSQPRSVPIFPMKWARNGPGGDGELTRARTKVHPPTLLGAPNCGIAPAWLLASRVIGCA